MKNVSEKLSLGRNLKLVLAKNTSGELLKRRRYIANKEDTGTLSTAH